MHNPTGAANCGVARSIEYVEYTPSLCAVGVLHFISGSGFSKKSNNPGVIVSSVVLMPSGTLIPDTLKKNGVTLPEKDWRASELRALNKYLMELIKKEGP